jgi:ATP-dependent Clp protease ATP-binding subunit ClpA
MLAPTGEETMAGRALPTFRKAMKPRHSDSLILIWQLAELEARHLNSPTIEPTHLLLGLLKSVDVDLLTLFANHSPNRDEILEEALREVRRLRTVFETAGLDARAFRRALRRQTAGPLGSPSDSQRLRRSKSAKQVFADAEHFAEIGNSMVFPVHLFYAVLSSTDETHSSLMVRLGCTPDRLRKVARREVMTGCARDQAQAGRN